MLAPRDTIYILERLFERHAYARPLELKSDPRASARKMRNATLLKLPRPRVNRS